MSDEALRELERHVDESQEALYRYRVACMRAGEPELAGFMRGDKVRWVTWNRKGETVELILWVKDWVLMPLFDPHRGVIEADAPMLETETLEGDRPDVYGMAWPSELELLEPATPTETERPGASPSAPRPSRGSASRRGGG